MSGFTVVLDLNRPAYQCLDVAGSLDDQIAARGWYVRTAFATGNPEDRICSVAGGSFVVFDGVLFNDVKLKREINSDDLHTVIRGLASSLGDNFPRVFRGEFSGCTMESATGSWCFFTNQTGSKPLYYWFTSSQLIVSSSISDLIRHCKLLGHHVHLDLTGCYMLLTYGFMLGDTTLYGGVRKLQAGRTLQVHRGRVTIGEYYQVDYPAPFQGSYDEALEGVDYHFRNAVDSTFLKDVRNGRCSVASLSAGLDSRMVAYVSHDLGYSDVLHINYAQTGSFDEEIPRVLAADLARPLLFFPLDEGRYLTKTLEEMNEANGGLIHYAGASHTLSMCRLLNFSRLGTIHSGMIGDVVFGSFLSGKSHTNPVSGQGAISTRFLHRIGGEERHHLERYPTSELFTFHNRQLNGSHNGTFVSNIFSDMSSPFLYPEFLEYMLSLDPSVRYGERLYLDWIIRYYPRAAKQRWGATGLSIDKSRSFQKPLQYLQSGLRRVFPLRAMNPLQYWYDRFPHLRSYMDDYVDRNLDFLSDEPQLCSDTLELFNLGNFGEKAVALTLICAAKSLFADSHDPPL